MKNSITNNSKYVNLILSTTPLNLFTVFYKNYIVKNEREKTYTSLFLLSNRYLFVFIFAVEVFKKLKENFEQK